MHAAHVGMPKRVVLTWVMGGDRREEPPVTDVSSAGTAAGAAEQHAVPVT